VARKTPVKHVVRSHIRLRRGGKSHGMVRSYVRGKGSYEPAKPRKGTPAYLSDHPSPSEVIRAGYGVGARVKLVAPQTGWNGQPLDPMFSHPVGSKGRITGHFNANPVVHWDSEARKDSGQVVEANKLMVIGKPSGKKEVIGRASYAKIQRELSGNEYYEEGGKVTIMKTEPVFDDVGYIVGDVTYSLVGRKHGDHVDFDTPKIDLSSVPRRQRYMVREYWESQDPKDMFGDVFE